MNEIVELACGLVKSAEGLSLRAYPDPASDLGKAMRKARIMAAYIRGQAEIPEALRGLSGAPWTIGYGETAGVVEGMVWTREQAEERLKQRVAGFLVGVLRVCPQLIKEAPRRVAACVSLAYNIGLKRFRLSSVCRSTQRREYAIAAERFRYFIYAAGQALPGLVARREAERALYLAG